MSTRSKIWLPIVVWAAILLAVGYVFREQQNYLAVKENGSQLGKLHQFFIKHVKLAGELQPEDLSAYLTELASLADDLGVQAEVFNSRGQSLSGGSSVVAKLLDARSRVGSVVRESSGNGEVYLTRYGQLYPAKSDQGTVLPLVDSSADVLEQGAAAVSAMTPVFLRTRCSLKSQRRKWALSGTSFWRGMSLLWLLPALAWWLILKNMLQPIDAMSEAFKDIGRGSSDVRIPELACRSDDWFDLYSQFRSMQDSFQMRQDLLSDSNQRFVAMLASMAEGVMAINSDGNVILANRAVRSMLMLTMPDIIGRRLVEMVRIPELFQAIEAAQKTGNFQKAEFKTLHQPRRNIDARLTSLDSLEKNGVAIVFQDVTEIRALETMRRDFVANVSHELKTPLASIKAYAETLRMGALDDKEKNISFVEQIESQADLLHLQIQDLMEIARVESGSLSSELEPVSVNQACGDCVTQLFDLANIANIELTLELTSEDPIVMASNEGLLTIINNLVANAVNYTPANGRVWITTRREQQEAVIEIADTGIGIGKEHQDRVFERFYRVDKARSRDVGGTGLGLSIVKHTVQAFEGKIFLESEIGKGTKFEIRLPLLSTEYVDGSRSV
ncbi:ATP-binding protein [bacterium]|nr:ATP-binding protein [bacterium]